MRQYVSHSSICFIIFAFGVAGGGDACITHPRSGAPLAQMSPPASPSAGQSDFAIPRGWEKFNVGDFSFHHPPELRLQRGDQSEGQTLGFRSSKMTLSIDNSFYPNRLMNDEGSQEYCEENVWIDGRAAKVVTFRLDDSATYPERNRKFVAAIHFPELNEGMIKEFTFWAACADQATQAEALKIFHSIKFKAKP